MRAFLLVLFTSGKDRSLGNDFYIGTRDHIKEGVWRATETDYKCGALNFTNWYGNEPDNWLSSEHCAALDVSRKGKWGDRPCDDTNHFLCQVFE